MSGPAQQQQAQTQEQQQNSEENKERVVQGDAEVINENDKEKNDD